MLNTTRRRGRGRRRSTARIQISWEISRMTQRRVSLRDLARPPSTFVYLNGSFSKQELDLVHGRITSLEHLRLHRFANHLKKLCLRQNYVAHLDPGLFSLLTRLEELDLYDNKVKTPGDALNCLSKLT